MHLLDAILLGLMQGLSEFLPVSSTAHVTLVGRLTGALDPADPQAWTAFLAVVQLGTLLAVLAYFQRDLVDITRDVLTNRPTPARRMGWLIVLGTVPIAVVGLALRDVIEGPLTKDLRVIASSLIVFALLLALAERLGRRQRGLDALGPRDALLIGAFQTFSLVPGASRSGTTLTGGLFAGLDRPAAARFSFLLSVPAIAASGLLQLPQALAAPRDDVLALALATLAAATSGYAAIWFLLRWLQRHDTTVFIAYRIALGAGILLAVGLGVVAA